MDRWTRQKTSRGTALLKAIHIAGFDQPLILDDGKRIRHWRQELRTKLMMKGKELRQTAAEQFGRTPRTPEGQENGTAGIVGTPESVASMTMIVPQTQYQPEESDWVWDVFGYPNLFDPDELYC
jgi:hypothetical protein